MIDKTKWQMLITYADNGMIMENPNYVPIEDGDNVGGKFHEVIEMDENEDESLAEAKMMRQMVYRMIDYFGVNKISSHHSKYNLELKIVDTETEKEVGD